MAERALALDEQQVAALGALVHEPLGRAGDEVGDHVVDGDPPAGDGDPGLARWRRTRLQLAALARRRVELQRHRHLADRAVRADGVDDAQRPVARSGRGRSRSGRRRAQVAQLDGRARRRRDQLRVVGEHACAARPRRPCRRRSPRSSAARHSVRQRAAERARRRSRSTFAPSAAASATVATIGTGAARVRHDLVGAPAGVDASRRRATTSRGAVAQDAVARSWRCGVSNRPPVNSASRSAHAGSTPRPGASDSTSRPSAKPSPRNGRVRDQQVPVEVDVVGQRRRAAPPGAMPELGLDHAAEHDSQAERARRVDHAQRLADAAALGELDMIPSA